MAQEHVCKSKVCNPHGVSAGGAGAPSAGAAAHSTAELAASAAASAHSRPALPHPSSNLPVSPAIAEKMKNMMLDTPTLKQYMDVFLDNINRGLKKDTHDASIVKCFPTYVQDLPSGEETGKFLALDLGGSNFRVLMIELAGSECHMDSEVYAIPDAIMKGSGPELFDYIAECVWRYASSKGVQDDNLPLGFTFSFPLVQKGLSVGLLERWTKGFHCQDVLGQDVVQLLKDAIDRRGDVKIDVCAVLNDTTGTLMSCAWKNHDTKIGLIVGTGSNACYLEKQANAELFDEPDMGSGNVIINLEWGALGDDGALNFIQTKFDEIVDEQTINPGKQQHEKMISGMYMGELVRVIAETYAREGLMFGGQVSEKFASRGAFDTKYVSEIESDPPGTFTNARNVCNSLDMGHATDKDLEDLRYIASIVSSRAAHLVSSGLVCLMHKMGYPSCTVGIDGTLYKMHPHFHDQMVQKINELIRPGIQFNLMLSEDGSGRGAALVAAVAARKAREAAQK